MHPSVKVLLYEDNHELREGLSFLLQATPGITLGGAYANARNIRAELHEHLPDVLLLDIQMPGLTGLEALPIIKSLYPRIQVLMITVFDDDDNIFQAIRSGANGYLLKDTPPSEIIEAIRDVHRGGSPMTSSVARKLFDYFQHPVSPVVADHQLSPRELDVVRCLMNGYSYKMIADDLHISIETVRTHIRRMYDKLQVNSKTEVILKAIKGGWIQK
jgi:DNA-binding NarL/FixJ family response regulator